MIEVKDLTKFYGRLTAIHNVSFRIESGEIVGFLGPNGAGKTTTMRILTCFSPASSGEARILGMDTREHSLQIRRQLGYLPENVPLYDWMSVRSYLSFVAKGKGLNKKMASQEVERTSSAVGIESVSNKLIKNLSKGYRQRVGLAQALIGDPPILILDEPTIGLDPRQIREIRKLIKGFARNRTVILSTHILPEVSQVCDRVLIINKGTLIAEDSPRNLTSTHGKSMKCVVSARAPENELKDVLGQIEGVKSLTDYHQDSAKYPYILVESAAGTDLRPKLAKTIVEKGWDLLELKMMQLSLEDVFIDLVTEESEDEPTGLADIQKENAS